VVKRFGRTALAGLALVTALSAGCVRTDEGVAIRSEDVATPTVGRAAPAPSTDDAGPDAPGIVATTRAPIPANAVTCPPSPRAPRTTVTVADPQAPKVTVALPDGWTAAPVADDAGAKLPGPDGMFASVTITQTKLDPAAAFTDYADKAMAVSAVTSISVLPAELCGYSGQKLMGTWSDTPQRAVEFVDRVVHVWTNSNDYLVAVHVEAPAGTAGFPAASTVLIDDFSVAIP
jgi:hypothetical protein